MTSQELYWIPGCMYVGVLCYRPKRLMMKSSPPDFYCRPQHYTHNLTHHTSAKQRWRAKADHRAAPVGVPIFLLDLVFVLDTYKIHTKIMVYRYFFPAGGGGWIRRYTKFQKQIMQRLWETPDVFPLAPITLFDFTRPDDAADVLTPHRASGDALSRSRHRDAWRLSDDRVIGGYSESSAHLIRPSPPSSEEQEEEEKTEARIENENRYGEHDGYDDDDEGEDAQQSQQLLLNAKRPFLRWYGNLDTTVGLESRAQRSGFAALRSPTFHMGGANLRGAYTALEITCRTDGRVYTINLQVATSLPNDIFQGHIDVPATAKGRWDRLYLPFTEFGFLAPGGRGFSPRKQASRIIESEDTAKEQSHVRRRQSARQRALEIGAAENEKASLDDKVCIESIGFTLMDGQDGPFQFDLAQVRAVNFFEDEVFEKVPEREEPSTRFRL